MRLRVILVTTLIVLLALPTVLHAQEVEPEPEVVVSDQVTAVNEGDADAANDTMAENATVTVPAVTTTEAEGDATTSDAVTTTEAEGDATTSDAVTTTEAEGDATTSDAVTTTEAEGDPAAQATYTGTAEIQAYHEGQTAANANTTLGECSVAGETVTCAASYTSAALQGRGIDFLEGALVVTVVEGKIQSYAFTPSAASIAKIQAAFAAPTKLPVTGGTTPATTDYIMMLAAMGLLLLLAGAGTYAFQRRDI